MKLTRELSSHHQKRFHQSRQRHLVAQKERERCLLGQVVAGEAVAVVGGGLEEVGDLVVA
jgi:hypothetical protein